MLALETTLAPNDLYTVILVQKLMFFKGKNRGFSQGFSIFVRVVVGV
jgi:hypothetical protein